MSGAWEEPGRTALVVPAPEAEEAVGSLRRRYAAGGAEGVPAHVTLLIPFAPAAELEPLLPALEDVVSSWRPVAFTLRTVRRWPVVVWLEPEPSAPFAAMTEALVSAFPVYLPYEGMHEEVIPHLTVVSRDDDAVLARVAAEIERALPIDCAGDTVELLERRDDGRWHVRREWQLRR